MDRSYYQLIDEGTSITQLATAIARNADYKPTIKAASDEAIIDAISMLQKSKKILQHIISLQNNVNARSKLEQVL